AGLSIPHGDLAVDEITPPSTACQTFAVRAESHAYAVACLEGDEFLAGLGVPQLHRLAAIRTASQALAVRAEGHAADPAIEPLKSQEFLAGLGILHLHRLVVRSAGQAFAVRAVGHAP